MRSPSLIAMLATAFRALESDDFTTVSAAFEDVENLSPGGAPRRPIVLLAL